MNDSILRALASCDEQYPYLASALDSCKVVESTLVPTAAADKYGVIYCNPEFFTGLSRDEAGGVIAHEIWHILSEHHRRIGDRQRGKWNIAADAEINDDLGALPTGCVLPRLLDCDEGLTAEEYYEKTDKEELQSGSASDGVGKPWEKESDRPETPIDIEAVKKDVAENIKSRGIVGGLETWACNVCKVAIPPLSVRLREAAKLTGATPLDKEPSFSRPSKRQSNILRPGQIADTKSVLVLLDTSGSMVSDSGSLLSSISVLAKRYGDVSWAMADTELKARGKTRPKKLAGGGGTALKPILEELDAEGHALIIVVTDGYTNWPEDIITPIMVVLTVDGIEPPKDFPWVRILGET